MTDQPPATWPWVNLEALHPVLVARLAGLCAHPAWAGRLQVYSGARTRAEQVVLWRRWLARQGPVAADPDAIRPGAYGLAVRRGSWHMVQANGYAYAVDLTWSSLTADQQAALPGIAAQFRLIPTVPGEGWHYQMAWDDWTWTPNTGELTMADIDTLLARLDAIEERLNSVHRQVSGGDPANRPLRDSQAEIWRAVTGGGPIPAVTLQAHVVDLVKRTRRLEDNWARVLELLPDE